jgi:hypothetical protein
MDVEFDTAKDAINVAKHGVSLVEAILLFESDFLVRPDGRKMYGEERLIAYGEIGGRVHVCVYTMRDEIHRIISLRKANRREIDAYRER